jgi:putative heme-binding domain-containing protein
MKSKRAGDGNGHACVGMTIYQGDNWPDEYRGRVLTLNLFGHRVNQEILERAGSGYVAHAGPDIVFIQDPWFRGLEISYGPDGGVYILDWSDDGDYHDRSGVHRDSGRIYKVTYGDAQPSNVGDLRALDVEQLVALHTHRNEWFPRQAREELITRTLDGRGVGKAKDLLHALFDKEKSAPLKLRALWTLYGLGAVDDRLLLTLTGDPNEHLRVWGVRLLTDFWPIDNVMSKRPARSVAGPEIAPPPAAMNELVRLAKEDPSGLVRLSLASTLQRLPVAHRPQLAAALVSHAEDAKDHNLPLLIWYGLIPVAEADAGALARLAGLCELPKTRTYMARRLAEELDKNLIPVNDLLHATLQKPDAFQADILDGLAQGLKGVRKSVKPPVWDEFAAKVSQSGKVALSDKVRNLSVILGDTSAMVAARRAVMEKSLDVKARKSAFQAIIDARPADLRDFCESLLEDRLLNALAAGALASFDDAAIGPALVKAYPHFEQADRPHLIAALTSRPAHAKVLLTAVEEKKIPRADISAFDAAQIRSLNDSGLNKKLSAVWGEARETPADKQQQVLKLKAQLTPDVLAKADKSQGRVLFTKTCAACHKLYGEGSDIGPDLTGGGRQKLDFLLPKIVDPSSIMSLDFRTNVVELKDGRIVSAIITAQTDRMVTLKNATQVLTVEREQIASIRDSSQSLMPDGLLAPLSAEQVRDLIAYLSYPVQVPLPENR